MAESPKKSTKKTVRQCKRVFMMFCDEYNLLTPNGTPSVAKLYSLSYQCRETAQAKNLLPDVGKEKYRGVFRPDDDRPIPRKYHEDVLRLMRHAPFNFVAPEDAFRRKFETDAIGYAYLKQGPEQKQGVYEVTHYTARNHADYALKTVEAGFSSYGLSFLRDPELRADASLSLGRLADVIVGNSLNTEQVRKMGEISRRVDACGTCGGGSVDLLLFEPVFSAVANKHDDISAKLQTEADHVGLANIHTKESLLHGTTGNKEKASEAAKKVFVAAKQGYLGPPRSEEVLALQRVIKSNIDKNDHELFREYAERLADVRGSYSSGHVSSAQCMACCAISGRLQEVVGFDEAEAMLENARQILSRALLKPLGRSDEEMARLRRRANSINYLGLCLAEKRFEGAHPRDQDGALRSYLRKHGVTLEDLKKTETSNIRRAKILHWEWKVTYRQHAELLKAAKDLLYDPAWVHVKTLCVMDADHLRDMVAVDLKNASGD